MPVAAPPWLLLPPSPLPRRQLGPAVAMEPCSPYSCDRAGRRLTLWTVMPGIFWVTWSIHDCMFSRNTVLPPQFAAAQIAESARHQEWAGVWLGHAAWSHRWTAKRTRGTASQPQPLLKRAARAMATARAPPPRRLQPHTHTDSNRPPHPVLTRASPAGCSHGRRQARAVAASRRVTPMLAAAAAPHVSKSTCAPC